MTNKYFLIDAIKVVLAVMIVCLHSLPFAEEKSINTAISVACQFCVPLFFAFSGFFFEKKRKLGSAIKRILILYAFWFVFCWPLMLTHYKGLNPLECLQLIVFSYTFSVSWYLPALIWSMIIVTYMHKIRGGYALCALLSVALYFMCVSIMGWEGFFADSWITPVNAAYRKIFYTINWSFPQGLIFFLIGFHAHRIRSIRTSYLVMAVIASAALFVWEEYYVISTHIAGGGNPVFSLPLLIASLMALILNFCRDTRYVNEGKQLRRFSTFLYLSHPLIMAVVYKITGRFYGISCLLVVCAISLTLFLLHDKLQTRKYFRWLRYAC